MSEPLILHAAVGGSLELEQYELAPESLVAGDPKPRLWSVSTDDGNGRTVVAGVFEADPGTIRNRVRATETIHVLKGRVRIELDPGNAVDLAVGDMAVLPCGPIATWTFIEPYRELFVLSGVNK